MKRKLQVILMTVMAILVSSQSTTAQVPYGLNSFPSASATIFIDFDGQTVVSPYWNGGSRIECLPAALTTAQMTRVFNQVAEDFRPFNLNITTDSAVYFAAPITKRQRVIITPTSTWYGSAGGVAYLECFRWGLEIPAFVFSNLLGNNGKSIAEAAAHEAGHTLGLYHQAQYNSTCGFVTDYNPGIGTGEISWAPIMGNSYSRNITTWHNGPNSFGCNNLQDDVSIIGSAANGFGFRTDDINNTTSAASNIDLSASSYTLNGFINSTNDIDVFKLNLQKDGHLTLTGLPFNVNSTNNASANIDLQVSLLNSSGAVIGSYNPSNSVKAIVDSILTAGTYYVRVANTSNINASNYGMLGNYGLSGAFVANSSLPVYNLDLNGTNIKNKHELKWSIIADEGLESITIEASEDGKTFNKLQVLGGESRSFTYQPIGSSSRFYRLHVVTASQLEYYSNIITLKSSSGDTKFNIMGNRISGNEIVIQSKGNYNYRLLDMGGRNIQSGRMNIGVNRISSTAIQSGMYLIQIIDGTEVTTERLMIQ
jgi:hypothetical protein